MTTAETPQGTPRRPRWVMWAVIAAAAVAFAAVAVPVYLMSTSAFVSRLHGFSDNYSTLQSSKHAGISCVACHPQGPAAKTIGFYRGVFVRQTDTAPLKMARPANAACMKCHVGDWSDDARRTSRIPHPAHLRVADETRECVRCHKWTAHQEKFLQKHKKMPFSGVCVAYGCHVGWKTKEQCSTCHHVLYKGAEEWKKAHPAVVRTAGALGCLETCHEVAQCRLCHTTGKTPVFKGLAIQTGLKAIESQHARPTWIARHGALALADQSKCLLCHGSLGECESCHARRPAFHGSTRTWTGTHSRVAKAVDDPRCLTCHEKAWCEECHAKFKEMR